MELTAGDFHWQISPECRERLIGPEGLRLQEWLESGQASIVKHGPHRTVYSVNLSDFHFHLKHHRLPNLRAWLRQLVRPPKARMEYERALALTARGIPTITPLGLGEGCARPGPGDSFLITQTLAGAETLTTYILTTLPRLDRPRRALIRQNLARELAKLLAQIHDAGILHHDLHAGNILVCGETSGRVRLYLIDLHAVHVGQPLGWRSSRENLIMFNRWFLTRSSRADRLRFWRGYCRLRGRPGGLQRESAGAAAPGWKQMLDRLAGDLEQRTWASAVSFWRNRDRRCRASNRYYKRVRGPAGFSTTVGYTVRDLDTTALEKLLKDPDEPFRRPEFALLKDSPSSTVAEFDMLVNGTMRRVIYKRFRIKSWAVPWMSLVRPSKATRSWVLGQGLCERGLPTARPLAILQRRRLGLDYEGYLLTEKIENAVDLHEFVDHLRQLEPARRRHFLRSRIDQLGQLIQLLHLHQLAHRDLKAANVLLTGNDCPKGSPIGSDAEPRYWLIDLVGVTRHGKLSRRRRVQNLSRINASFHADGSLTTTDRLRFLRRYLQWGVHGRGGWKKWWREIRQATLDKVDRNLLTGRPLA